MLPNEHVANERMFAMHSLMLPEAQNNKIPSLAFHVYLRPKHINFNGTTDSAHAEVEKLLR